jgi:hypothetical protein
MKLKAARFVNLFLTGVLAGNEFGGLTGFHPALYRLPTEVHASAEQEITARFGKIMPPFMIATIFSFVPVVSLARDRRSFRFTLAGTGHDLPGHGLQGDDDAASSLAPRPPATGRAFSRARTSKGTGIVGCGEGSDADGQLYHARTSPSSC